MVIGCEELLKIEEDSKLSSKEDSTSLTISMTREVK